ncbi:BTAD domain-containing putative transcriptional regulator [Prescottella defluvii]|nr:BTAD domain-containing putative transcriptional regulator [Prescottella defluvii]
MTAEDIGNALALSLSAIRDTRPRDAQSAPAEAAPLVVIDNGEVLAYNPSASSVVREVLLSIPTGVDVLILTSRHLGIETEQLVLRGMCEVLAADRLRLTHDEAGALAARLGPSGAIDPVEAVRQCAGWASGVVLFMRFGAAPGLPTSPVLVAYIESRIVDTLPPDEMDLLLAGSLLEKSPAMTAWVCSARGVSRCLRHCAPGNYLWCWSPTMPSKYSPLLRQCLQEILSRRRSERLPKLRRRFAFHLAAGGRLDELVEWCMAADEPHLAVEALAVGVRSLADPAEVVTRVDRWALLIGEAYLLTNDLLTACMLRAIHARRGIDKAVTLIHQLEADGRMDDIVAADPGIVGIVLWTLHSRPDDAAPYARNNRDNHGADAIRFMLAATSGVEPALPPLSTVGEEMAPIVHWGMLWQGRCGDIIGTLDGPDADDNPNVALAAVWSGRIDVAERAFERIPPARRDRPHAIFVRAAIEIARGHFGSAQQILRAGAPGARSSGVQSDYEVLAAWAALRIGAPEEAAALPHSVIELDGGERRAISEWARLVLGLALLDLDKPGDAAVVLGPAVDSMRRARRQLLFSAASYALAEAHVRIGDEATAAAVLADMRRGAGVLGGTYWTEEVLERCYELRRGSLLSLANPVPSDATPEQPAPAAPDNTTAEERQPASVELLPFHEPPQIVVDGVSAPVRRLKVVELIADLAQNPEGVERSRLQERLFPEVGRSRGGNHFRQIVFRLRELTGVRLERRDANIVAWPDSVELVAHDRRFEDVVLRSRSVKDPAGEQMQALREALDLAPGVYLGGSNLPGVEERRTYLSVLFEEAVTKLMWWAAEEGDAELVRRYGARALEFNPFSEEIYGLLIRSEHLVGNRAAAMAIYQRAHSALGELGLEPGPDLRRLVQVPARSVNDRARPGFASR